MLPIPKAVLVNPGAAEPAAPEPGAAAALSATVAEVAEPGVAGPEVAEPVVTGLEVVGLGRATPVETPADGFTAGELTLAATPTGLIAFLVPVAAMSLDDVLGEGALREVALAGPAALEGVAPLIGTPTGLEVPADAGIAR